VENTFTCTWDAGEHAFTIWTQQRISGGVQEKFSDGDTVTAASAGATR
jgi:hypothetical protein